MATQNSQSDNPAILNQYYIELFNIFKKWWWAIGLITILTATATNFYAKHLEPEYKAHALVEVKQKEQTIVNVEGIENITADKEFLTTQVELLQSRKLMLAVAEQLNLTSASDMLSQEQLGLPKEERQKLIIQVLQKRLSVLPVGRSRLIAVSFEHPKKERTALIANTIVNTFISDSDQDKINSNDRAKTFLQDQLISAKDSLAKAEEQLISYADKNKLIILGNDTTQDITDSLDTASLVKLDAELTIAQTDRIKAEQAYLHSKENGFNAQILSDDTYLKLSDRRLELESEYTEKLAIFKPAYPGMVQLQTRIDQISNEIDSRAKQIQSGNLSSYKTDYDLALGLEQSLKQRVERLKASVVDLRTKSIEYKIISRNVEIERTQYNAMLQRLKEVSLSDGLGSNLVQVVDYATVPSKPFKPNRKLYVLLGSLFGLLISTSLAFLYHVLDDRIKVPNDVKNKLGQTLMGVIPSIKTSLIFEDMLADPQSGIAEAYATLRTNLQFSGPNGGPRVIQVTSTRAAEGKSTSSLGLALRFAGAGSKTLLIDADMRRPTFTAQKGKLGLSDLLTSNDGLKAAISKTHFDDKLDLIASGPQVPNPSEILATHRMNDILKRAQETYDYVIVDSPPVLGLADAPTIGAKVEASLVVVEAGRLYTKNVISALERLGISGTKVLGVVLTKLSTTESGYGDYYGYGYTYGNQKKSNKKLKTKTKQESKRKLAIAKE